MNQSTNKKSAAAQHSAAAEDNEVTFVRKTINGAPNPLYVNLLDDDDPVISSQQFVCVSFVSPEDILKKKEIYYFEEFLKKWELNTSMETFLHFLSFVSYKYSVLLDDMTNDFKEFVADQKDKILKSNMNDDYKTFLEKNQKDLDEKFNIEHKFQTNTRGLKIRGSFATQLEAEMRGEMLRADDPNHNIFVGQVGGWMPWNNDAYLGGKVKYLEEELNQLMVEKSKNDQVAKNDFDKRVRETKQNAIEENIKKAEKSGNTLTQTIDVHGNLIGVNSGSNTQESRLNAKESISSADVHKELFEGENIVLGGSDNGRSQLVSGPFAAPKDVVG